MKDLIAFIRRERLYLLLLIFIILINVVIVTAPGRHHRTDTKRQAVSLQPSEMKSVQSQNTPEEETAARRERVEKLFTENRSLALIFSLTSLLILAVFFLGVALDAILVVRRLTGKRLDIATYHPQAVRWGVWDVAKVIILFLFFGYMLIIIESLLIRVLPIVKDQNIRMVFNSTILDILSALFIFYFSLILYKEKIASLGLSLKNFFRNVLYGIAAYVAILPVLVAILAAIAIVANMTHYVPQKQAVVELFLKEKNVNVLLYTSIFAAIFGPVFEELFFRGFMYNALKKGIGVFWSMVISASLFAALHAHAVGFFPIMVLGLLLAYLYEKTGTLVSSITVHVAHNLAMVCLVFLIKPLGIG